MQPIHCMGLRSAKINAMCGDNCDSAKIPAINVSKLLMLHTGAVVPHSTNFAAEGKISIHQPCRLHVHTAG